MKRFTLLMLLVLVTGCATMYKQQLLDSTLGKDPANFGPPWPSPFTMRCNSFGEIMYEYALCGQRTNGGMVAANAVGGFGNTISSVGHVPSTYQMQPQTYMGCDVLALVARNNVVVRARMEDLSAGEQIRRNFYPMGSDQCKTEAGK
jgi:hypothetical protein